MKTYWAPPLTERIRYSTLRRAGAGAYQKWHPFWGLVVCEPYMDAWPRYKTITHWWIVFRLFGRPVFMWRRQARRYDYSVVSHYGWTGMR